ncbi:MAG: phosphoribosylglycinamide formyltransferase [Clostridiales bacterium]|jgi:phosphoribosylglycinamide formyltransferase-1|nr:phosphoribosylglycinamide formyltransferase [Clostridiales bacterium]
MGFEKGITRIAVLISGGGTNLQALLDAQAGGRLPRGRVALVVSDRKNAGGLARAAKAGVASAFVSRKDPGRLVEILRERQIDLIVLAGYLSILPGEVIASFRGRVINIHPALTPLFSGMGFYGLKVHEAVLASGMKVTGATVHFVDEGVDTGTIIAQRPVPVLDGDTPEILQARVLETEHALLTDCVKALTECRVRAKNGKAWVEE